MDGWVGVVDGKGKIEILTILYTALPAENFSRIGRRKFNGTKKNVSQLFCSAFWETGCSCQECSLKTERERNANRMSYKAVYFYTYSWLFNELIHYYLKISGYHLCNTARRTISVFVLKQHIQGRRRIHSIWFRAICPQAGCWQQSNYPQRSCRVGICFCHEEFGSRPNIRQSWSHWHYRR